MKTAAQRLLEQIYPPVPSPYSEEELACMAAPPTREEAEQDRRRKQADRTKNQRSRHWWNHR